MRENRLSGSEGGGTSFSLPLLHLAPSALSTRVLTQSLKGRAKLIQTLRVESTCSQFSKVCRTSKTRATLATALQTVSQSSH